MTRPLLCDVIAVPTMAELRAGRDAAAAGADLVELRLDTVDRPDVAGALHGRRGPVIVTCRAAWEGGHFKGSEEERQQILGEALAAGAEFVDIEWRTAAAMMHAPPVPSGQTPSAQSRSGQPLSGQRLSGREQTTPWLRPEDGARVILSRHDFDGVPADLAATAREMRRANPAGVVKVAGRARRLRDLVPLLEIGRAQAEGDRTVLIGMGMPGVASRILAAHFGSAWTYAGPAVAPGQIEASRLRDEFRFHAVTARTQVYAVVGQPIAHSISPAMHNAAFEALGIDAVYVPCEAVDFDDFLALADALPIVGASVTAPFKLAAYERSRPMDDDARRVGAANTLRRIDGGHGPRGAHAHGGASATGAAHHDDAGATGAAHHDDAASIAWESRNTDVAGFLAPLEARGSLRGVRAAILGTGGAARAVVVGLGAAGARVTVHARNAAAGAEVAALAQGEVRGWTVPADSWDLLINTTPIGTFPAVADTPYGGPFAPDHVVYDLVYNPRPTRLLRDAAAAGCVTLDGLDMLVEQAARQLAWWTGRAAPVDVMRAAAERRLAEMAADASAAEPAAAVRGD